MTSALIQAELHRGSWRRVEWIPVDTGPEWRGWTVAERYPSVRLSAEGLSRRTRFASLERP